ncbi:phage head closure protein [Phenylobacterium sp. J426]|uniref:phage head closure protein n=1 Tax=Phenylobacterium sp. J426 TaxID=2898439 RepID=UPI002150CDC8|nr:phage head closure protein [Phenylobacterium sp. J426]MCR5874367.1 phage head closure protein [Phenylobacterium sp. J426]
MRAGKLDRRLTLLSYGSDGTNAFGDPADAWTDIGTVWASKQDVSDAERMRAQALGATITTRFIVRSTERARGLKRRDRVRCDGVTYDVVGLKEVGRRDGIEITAAAAEEG